MEEKDIKEPQGTENESNAAKRLRLLGIENDDKIHDEAVVIKKGNFLSNFWYQHKWSVIIGAVLIFTAVVFIVSMATQPDYDMYISYAGPLYTDGETKLAIEYAFGEMAEDYDGDGEKLLNFAGVTYQNEEQRKQTAAQMKENYGIVQNTHANYEALDTIRSQMLSGTVAIYLMDEALYKEYEASMLDLNELLGYELDPSIMAGKSGVYFKKTDFFFYMYAAEEGRALNNLPDDTVLCILPELATMDEDMHKNSVELIKDVLNFTIE